MHRSLSPGVAGALAMVACAFLWSTAGLFIKLIDWNPFWIAGFRSLIAGAFLFTFVRTFRLRWSWPLVGAAVANAACMILFVLANKLTTSANAILIQYWAPVGTAILGALVLKERLRAEQLVALTATLAGLVLLFVDKLGPGAFWGNLAAFASGLAFALMFLFTRMQKDANPLQSLMLSHVIAAVVSLSIAVFQPLPVVTFTATAAIFALGIGQIGLAAVFFSYGIKRVSALTANLLAVIEPVFNPVWVFLLLGESPSAWTIAGGGLIVVSVTMATLMAARGLSVDQLRKENGLLTSIIESASEAIYAKDRAGRFVVVNENGARLIGYRRDQVLGRSHQELEATSRAQAFRSTDQDVMESGESVRQEYSLEIAGQTRQISSHKSPWMDHEGQIIGIIGVSSDITERKQAEEKVQTLLAEKELLLREVHHRIKNNMGTVVALLTLQADTTKSQEVVSSLEEAKNRIYSMMVLYDKLYQAENYRAIPLGDYLAPLVDEILANFPGSDKIKLEMHFEDVVIDVDKLQSLGIIVNELITNAMKYAFLGRTEGRIIVASTVRGAAVALSVSDDGVGMGGRAGTGEDEGFGLGLIRLLTKSLHGQVSIRENNPGVAVTVQFLT